MPPPTTSSSNLPPPKTDSRFPYVPGPDLGSMMHLSSPSRPAPQYGKDLEATAATGRVLQTPPPGVKKFDWEHSGDKLMRFVHGYSLRQGAMQAARSQGYPGGTPVPPPRTLEAVATPTKPASPPPPRWAPPPATDTFREQMQQSFPGRTPKPTIHLGDSGSFYHPPDGKLVVGTLDEGGAFPSYLSEYRHEADHSSQFPDPKSQATVSPETAGQVMAGAELGPSLGDMLWLADDHLKQTGKPLDHQVNFPSGVSQNTAWMARQARQHGVFDGSSTAAQLGTPSGQAYTRNLINPGVAPAPPAQPQGWGSWFMNKIGF